MPRHRTYLWLAFGFCATGLLAACGDNPDGKPRLEPESDVSLDRNVVTATSTDISVCRRYPSRC